LKGQVEQYRIQVLLVAVLTVLFLMAEEAMFFVEKKI